MEQKLKLQLQVQEMGVIGGFCYPYARLLLDEAIALKEGKTLFCDEGFSNELTEFGYSVLIALAEQVSPASMTDVNPEQADELIETAQRFLAIFEK